MRVIGGQYDEQKWTLQTSFLILFQIHVGEHVWTAAEG